MPVPAIELRPRGAIGMVDAAIRLCSQRAEIWALALPGGAAVAFAVTVFVEAVQRRTHVAAASAVLAAAWLVRALFQGATSDYVEKLLVAPEPPRPYASIRAALAHAPALFITSAFLLAFNAVTLPFTLGLALFFLSAHVAAYAVAMKEAGHPLAIYATCSRLLGAARNATPGVRLALWSQGLVALNLHIAVNILVWMGRKLLGLELTFAQRYASMDNVAWDVAVIAVAFAAMEPIRAALGALLVVDGRVRKDGVDLQTALEQLPKRGRRSGTAAAAAIAFALLCAWPAPARAGEGPPAVNSELADRLWRAAAECRLDSDDMQRKIAAVTELGDREHSSLARFLTDVESLAYDDQDCEALERRLDGGLQMIAEAKEALDQGGGADPRLKAKEILSRPEFQTAPAPKPEVDKPKEDSAPSWWDRFLDWLKKKLEEWLRPKPRDPIPAAQFGGGMPAAKALVVILVAAVIAVAIWLVLRARNGAQGPKPEIDLVGGAAAGEEKGLGALARAPEGWALLADELSANGDFREAVRHLYLALLSRLHREGAIDYDPSLSNWDYLRRFKGSGEWRTAFRELTFRFDYAFYGKADVGEDGYRAFRGLCEPILRPAGEPARKAG